MRKVLITESGDNFSCLLASLESRSKAIEISNHFLYSGKRSLYFIVGLVAQGGSSVFLDLVFIL